MQHNMFRGVDKVGFQFCISLQSPQRTASVAMHKTINNREVLALSLTSFNAETASLLRGDAVAIERRSDLIFLAC